MVHLTHRVRDKIAENVQTAMKFKYVSWMRVFLFWFKMCSFGCSWQYVSVYSCIYWLGTEQATDHFPKQLWTGSLTAHSVTRPQWDNFSRCGSDVKNHHPCMTPQTDFIMFVSKSALNHIRAELSMILWDCGGWDIYKSCCRSVGRNLIY